MYKAKCRQTYKLLMSLFDRTLHLTYHCHFPSCCSISLSHALKTFQPQWTFFPSLLFLYVDVCFVVDRAFSLRKGFIRNIVLWFGLSLLRNFVLLEKEPPRCCPLALFLHNIAMQRLLASNKGTFNYSFFDGWAFSFHPHHSFMNSSMQTWYWWALVSLST